MNPYQIDETGDLEDEVDGIEWKNMQADIDHALMDNLAAELGFPTFDRLVRASRLIADGFYLTHFSDDRWAWWNPLRYAQEDPFYFDDHDKLTTYITELLQLNEEQVVTLHTEYTRMIQTKRCACCDYEFNPEDPTRNNWDEKREHLHLCSSECFTEVESVKNGAQG